MRVAVNVSIMGQDLPLGERLDAVADAGFEGVELWWPFEEATPDDAEDHTALLLLAEQASGRLVQD